MLASQESCNISVEQCKLCEQFFQVCTPHLLHINCVHTYKLPKFSTPQKWTNKIDPNVYSNLKFNPKTNQAHFILMIFFP